MAKAEPGSFPHFPLAIRVDSVYDARPSRTVFCLRKALVTLPPHSVVFGANHDQ